MAAQPREEYERIQKAFLKVLPNPMTQAQQMAQGVQRATSPNMSGQAVKSNPIEEYMMLLGGAYFIKGAAQKFVSEGLMTRAEAMPVMSLSDAAANWERTQMADNQVLAESSNFFGDTNPLRTSGANNEAILSDATDWKTVGDKATGFKEAEFNPMLDKATPAAKKEASDLLKNAGGTLSKKIGNDLFRTVAKALLYPLSFYLMGAVTGIFKNKEATIATYQSWYKDGLIDQNAYYGEIDSLDYTPFEKTNFKLQGDAMALPEQANRAAKQVAEANVPDQYKQQKAALGFTPDQITQQYQQEAEAAQNQPKPTLGQPPQGARTDYLSQAANVLNIVNNPKNNPSQGAYEVAKAAAQNILPAGNNTITVPDKLLPTTTNTPLTQTPLGTTPTPLTEEEIQALQKGKIKLKKNIGGI